MFALWSSPNHIPIKSKGPIKKMSHLRPMDASILFKPSKSHLASPHFLRRFDFSKPHETEPLAKPRCVRDHHQSRSINIYSTFRTHPVRCEIHGCNESSWFQWWHQLEQIPTAVLIDDEWGGDEAGGRQATAAVVAWVGAEWERNSRRLRLGREGKTHPNCGKLQARASQFTCERKVVTFAPSCWQLFALTLAPSCLPNPLLTPAQDRDLHPSQTQMYTRCTCAGCKSQHCSCLPLELALQLAQPKFLNPPHPLKWC